MRDNDSKIKNDDKQFVSDPCKQGDFTSTRIIEDIFTDESILIEPHYEADYDAYIKLIWEANPEIYDLLRSSPDLESARESLYSHLAKVERSVFSVENDLHILEKATIRECIRVLRSIIGPINERRTGFSALRFLRYLAREERSELTSEISVGFIMEFINLFRGIAGRPNIYRENGEVKRGIPTFLQKKGREAALLRMDSLDDLGSSMKGYFAKYPSGLEEEVLLRRKKNRDRILEYFEGKGSDWGNYTWHLKNVVKEWKPLVDLIELTEEQKESIKKAVKHRIPFGITPYYLSLMDREVAQGLDHAIRAQVIPPKDYVDMMVAHKGDRISTFDFMGEHDTSPIDLVTRRYPLIAIIKPFNTCAQICVYCQRNWEIEGCLDENALASRESIDSSLAWLDEHESVGDVLITGGDPLVMKDSLLSHILEVLSSKEQVYRVRLGTRTPVVLPMRWTNELVGMLKEFHNPPKLEIAIVTHFEHSYEITPEALQAVQKIRNAGIGVYNQQVFTIENSRRFETAKLRRDLRSIGVDPYYTFNMKGKEETRRYMVPIARILQERKEEARLLPGLDRTDEPVFNVPRLGKNHLRAWQDHRLVMVLPTGSRVYELHPWEKNITPVPPYNYIDIPIYDYLKELAQRGENLSDYRTIWYYF